MPVDLMIAGPPVVVALVAAVGEALPALPRRAYPLVSVVAGIAWVSAVHAAAGSWTWSAPLEGIVVGLAASGLYSGVVRPAVAAVRERA